MKHRALHSTAHNLASSIAGGVSFITGYCCIEIFTEAACQRDGAITIDFLSGKIIEGHASEYLEGIISRFKASLQSFCMKHGVETTDFHELTVRYICVGGKRNFIVTITDKNNRRSSREYIGLTGERVKVLDQLGRIRSVKLLKPSRA